MASPEEQTKTVEVRSDEQLLYIEPQVSDAQPVVWNWDGRGIDAVAFRKNIQAQAAD